MGTSFWETILLDARSYSGGAFRPHAELHAKVRLREGHFTQWLNLWSRTVDELFAGERAELAKAHAHRVAQAFLGRLQHVPSYDDPAPLTSGLTVTRHGPRARLAAQTTSQDGVGIIRRHPRGCASQRLSRARQPF